MSPRISTPRPTAVSVYLFGFSALLAGLHALYTTLSTLYLLSSSLISFPSSVAPLSPQCLPEATGNALAAIAVGLMYILCAYQNNTSYFILTLFTRSLTSVVFWYVSTQAHVYTYDHGRLEEKFGGRSQARQFGTEGGQKWFIASLWEGLGALTTGLCLFWEWNRDRLSRETHPKNLGSNIDAGYEKKKSK